VGEPHIREEFSTMSVLDKVKGMLKGHQSQASQAVDKAGDLIDEKTGDKYSSKVDMVQDQAKKQLGADEQAPPPAAGGQAPPPPEGGQPA
jgi:hypothetical protein